MTRKSSNCFPLSWPSVRVVRSYESLDAHPGDSWQQIGRASEPVGFRHVFRNWRRVSTISLRRIQTSGDKILDVPLAKIGGKGLFVKEIEDALLSKEIDLAVHSMKDVPTALPDGLEILCVPPREDPRDALVTHDGCGLDQLKQGARIGTSSLRRQAQLLHYRPDFIIEMLRGNLDTRLRNSARGSSMPLCLRRRDCGGLRGAGNHGMSAGTRQPPGDRPGSSWH